MTGVLKSLPGHVLRGAGVVLIVVAAVAGGIGWLYVLRHVHTLKVGPRLAEVLPLQRLAGDAGQPLGRVIAAWLPAGLAAGAGVAVVSRLRRPARGAAVSLLAWVLVVVATAAADSVTANEPFRHHLHQQPHRLAIWVAAGLMGLGALVAPIAGRAAGRHAP